MIAQVTSLIAGHLGTGALVVTALLAFGSRLPIGFVRFCTASSAGLSAAAVALGAGAGRWIWLGVLVVSALWWFVLNRADRSPRWLAVVAAFVGTLSVLAFGASASDTLRPLAAAGAFSAALLLGAVTVTMVLGHWYLVDTSLSIAPLRRGAFWFWLAVAMRWLAVSAALLYGGWETLGVHRVADVVFSTSGLFFLFRSLMGLGAPLLLAALVWQTVRMRSTQSATGLLYVAVVLVLFGELISQFLTVATGYPL